MSDITPGVRAHLHALADAWTEWRVLRPQLLERSVARWDLKLGPLIAGRVSTAVYAVESRGRAAVLKIATPGPAFTLEADVLEAAGGRGYVHLFDRDDEEGALLLERLGPSIAAEGRARYDELPSALALSLFDPTEFVDPIALTLAEAWTVDVPSVPRPDAATHQAAKLRSRIERLADELDQRDLHGAAIERALLYCDRRLEAMDPDRFVLCHGSAHLNNLVRVTSPRPGAPVGYVCVDPDPVRCEPEFDLGVATRHANRLLVAADDPVVTLRSWCAKLAERTETDAEAVWQWAFIDRVATGLVRMEAGWPERGRPYLECADWLVARRS